jgi:hypothetical protein
MKFSIKVRNSNGGEPWTENYSEDFIKTQEQAEAWAKNTLAYFNKTCAPGEPTRELISVQLGDGDAFEKHWWVKQNLITLSDHNGIFDKVKCKKCDAEARRYGLTRIKRAAKWRAQKWDICPNTNPV